jgi:hypothetical protein
MLEITKDMVRKSIERDRGKERHVESISRALWPWRESLLIILVSFLAMLDYISTYAFLELSGNNNFHESGLIARWALNVNGFKGLLLVDFFAVPALIIIAISARFIYTTVGFRGFGRAAFVVVLTPYVIATMAAIYNNVVLTFL